MKQYFITRNLLIAALSLFSAPALAEPTGKERLDQFLDGLHTFEAQFVQTTHDLDGGSEPTAYGTFYLSRPNRFLWRYETPYQQYVLADGKDIWLVEPDLAQVTQRSQKSILKGTPAMLLAGEMEPEKEFRIVEQGTGLGFTWLELVPLDTESQYEQILLAFDDQGLVKLHMTDKLGQIIRFDFSQRERNSQLDETLFRFVPPPGYDILEQDE